MNRVRSALAVAIGVMACLAVVRVSATGTLPVYRDLELLGQSLSIVRDAYVDPVDVSLLVDYALRAMVESLDQHSTYLDSQDLEVINQEAEGTFGGVGLVIASKNGFITVVAPLDGSPAAEAGIRPADTIIEINGETTQGMFLRRAVALLRGPAESNVKLLIGRKGVDTDIRVNVERRIITVPSVPYSFDVFGPDDTRFRYVRLATFTSRAVEQSRQALLELLADGCRGLVLDLRANPGGLLEQAVGVSDLLLAENLPICYTLGDKGNRRTEHVSTTPDMLGGLPIAVLVEEGSASGAEIVASAIQDNRRGVVVGRQTFGKGTVQEVRELGDGTAVKLTTARWFTPGGFCIDRELGVVDTTRLASSSVPRIGILPNVRVEQPVLDLLQVELATTLSGVWLDSLAQAVRPSVADPRGWSVGDDLLATVGNWLAVQSPLAETNPDSAAALAAVLSEGPASARAFLGTEFARRWWGEVGAARYAALNDTLVMTALGILADSARYEAALDLRTEALADTVATDDVE